MRIDSILLSNNNKNTQTVHRLANELMNLGNLTRAGKYERQTEGYLAFNPAPLPPDPPIIFSSELQQALSRAECAFGHFDESTQFLHRLDLSVSMFDLQETLCSCRIDGIGGSLEDLLAAVADTRSRDVESDVHRVMNYLVAMYYGISEAKEASVATELIKRVHLMLRSLTRESAITPGEFRSNQVWIGPPGCRVLDAEFVPPPPHQIVQHMQSLDEFVGSNNDLPLLVKIGLIHSQFETIHPFRDGNGRVGRLIVTFLLCKSRMRERPVLYLSKYFERHRQQYYDKLQAVRDRGAWEKWLLFFLQAVEDASVHAAATVRRILAMQEQDRKVIDDKLGRSADNGHRLLDLLYEYPIVSVNQVKEQTGISYASANALVARLVECDLLREYTGRSRNRRYMLHGYVDIFNAP